ncbi:MULTISPECIES: inorganic phosphate transporter [Brucella]|uniref:Phosphate transporter n=1 Tax=Brucella lupini TaxID=255457 RepID=A0A256GGP8_9HYPH|nr:MULTISPECIES: inorganic phosphate transporter [Brucella]RNL47815.1 inorganic phosphate transporter [Ochrobactrum sp. MH181795]KAB2703007.1 inorganic phosphate transporter [Brucella lupini]KAB2724440.1 inorganic phosphate transporter [Brucella anthropi]KAB2736490.1 inorganic phosphate transporter [Brucella anthropi]KAB2792131.1 inorganic phosphate transporter [Brucella anthropi]
MAHEDLEARHLETLDRDLSRFVQLETATSYVSRPLVAPGIALVFIMLAGLVAAMLLDQTTQMLIVVAATVFGAYMALNIGANDVANNMGPAVGANALSMGGAIAIAAVFESAGALIAGADVVSTVATGIIAPDTLATPIMFIWAMMAALLASALWVNLATWIGAPVSTTHAVVGGVVGAGIVAAGFGAVNWSQMAAIAASWVISPVLGAIIAAGFLWLIKSRIIYRVDKIAAARVWVPILVGLMAGTFATYLIMKGLKQLIDVSTEVALIFGLAVGVGSWLILIPVIHRQSYGLENRNKSLKILFSIPLVVSAALLSFAHGANDVANAVGPLAAIVQTSQTEALNHGVVIPLWVMLIGACGISLGLCLFGPKLIRMVGNQITKLNPMRAYCVSLSAAITVILASWLGLPVSSTHIAIGAIFGVGFFREWDTERRLKKARQALPLDSIPVEERRRRKLVRRSHALTIAAAWVVTVPAAAILSAILFALLNQIPVGHS